MLQTQGGVLDRPVFLFGLTKASSLVCWGLLSVLQLGLWPPMPWEESFCPGVSLAFAGWLPCTWPKSRVSRGTSLNSASLALAFLAVLTHSVQKQGKEVEVGIDLFCHCIALSFKRLCQPSCGCLPFPGGSAGKESACSAGDLGSIPGLERSPGGRHGNPLQYSGLENPMDCIGHGVTESNTTE